MLFSQNGTLVGLPITITVLGSLGPVAQYVEIHNLSQANTFSCVSNNVTFIIPPLRKLVLTESTQQITLTGTGDYIVLANSVSQGNAAGPSLEPTLYGTGGLISTSAADGVTIEDTGTVIRVKDGGISSAKLAPLAVTTDKISLGAVGTSQLADLAVNFNKTGSGVNQNPGRGAAVLLDTTAVIVGDTFTLTFAGAPVVYEFTNGAPPVTPGAFSVDIPTLPGSLTIEVNLRQPLIEASGLFTDTRFGVSNQALIQAGTTLTGVATGGLLVENIAPVAESRVGLEFHSWTITAQNQTGYPIYTSGTVVGQWALETTAGGQQQTSLGVVFTPIAGGVLVAPNSAPGFKVNVILAVTY